MPRSDVSSRTCCSAIPHKNSRQSSIQKRCALRLLLISKAIIGRGLRLRRNTTEKSWSTSVLCPIEGSYFSQGTFLGAFWTLKTRCPHRTVETSCLCCPPPSQNPADTTPCRFFTLRMRFGLVRVHFWSEKVENILTWNSENSSKRLKKPNLSHVSGRPRRIYVRRCPETQNQSFGRRWHFFYSFCESV